MDFMRCVPYSFEVGLKVSVEMIHNTPDLGMFSSKEVLYKVIYSTMPPGLYYKDMPLSDGVHFTSEMVAASPLKAISFQGMLSIPFCPYIALCYVVLLDGMKKINPTAMDEKLCFVFDVRPIKLEFDKKMGDYKVNENVDVVKDKFSWAILPIGTTLVPTEPGSHMISGV